MAGIKSREEFLSEVEVFDEGEHLRLQAARIGEQLEDLENTSVTLRRAAASYEALLAAQQAEMDRKLEAQRAWIAQNEARLLVQAKDEAKKELRAEMAKREKALQEREQKLMSQVEAERATFQKNTNTIRNVVMDMPISPPPEECRTLPPWAAGWFGRYNAWRGQRLREVGG